MAYQKGSTEAKKTKKEQSWKLVPGKKKANSRCRRQVDKKLSKEE